MLASPDPMTAYGELEQRFTKIKKIENASAILEWDARTNLPEGANAERSEQLATLSEVAHQMLIDPQIGILLDQTKQAKPQEFTEWQSANLTEMTHQYTRATCVPATLIAKATKAETEAEHIWQHAKQENDFPRLIPYLSKVLELQKQIADLIAKEFTCSPYDALLDGYERGLCTALIDPIFDRLRTELPPLLERVITYQATQPCTSTSSGPFAIDTQKQLTHHIATQVGFDTTRGRIDQSAHPFTIPLRDDARLTTRIDETNILHAILATLHETGHAMYGQGLPEDWKYQPVGKDRGIVTHESQSLIIEKQAGRCAAYISYLAQEIQRFFPTHNGAFSPVTLQRQIHKVEPSFIRVYADEITYPLHIILRYDLERQMLDGRLAVRDLPEAWAAKMTELLGITPKDDQEGCLQDPHWSGGAWGYFPTYLLGAIMAAQLFSAACHQDPRVLNNLHQGDFTPLVTWLRTNIHAKGCLDDTATLLYQATSHPLNVAAFLRHLEKRYLPTTPTC